MLTAMSDALANLLRTHDAATLTVHDRSSSGYAVTHSEPVVDPGSGQTTEIPLVKDLEISRAEALFLLSKGALWTGRPEAQPRV